MRARRSTTALAASCLRPRALLALVLANIGRCARRMAERSGPPALPPRATAAPTGLLPANGSPAPGRPSSRASPGERSQTLSPAMSRSSSTAAPMQKARSQKAKNRPSPAVPAGSGGASGSGLSSHWRSLPTAASSVASAARQASLSRSSSAFHLPSTSAAPVFAAVFSTCRDFAKGAAYSLLLAEAARLRQT